ncbi:Fe-S cluster assembly protein SufD [Bacteroidia bacterium]|nr:Fe-S cluster assembly protein SufD [Bacteroidia bacterium]
MSLEQKYIELYATHTGQICRGFAPQVNAGRRALLDDFLASGAPDSKGEKYRYSDMRRIYGRDLSLPSIEAPIPGREGVMTLGNGVFADGEPLVVRADGVITGSLRAASVDFPEFVLGRLNSVATNLSDGLTALNGAMMPDGIFVYVPCGVDGGTIDVELLYDTVHEDDLVFSRMLVVLEEGAEARLQARYRGRAGNHLVVNHVTEAILGRGAKLQMGEAYDFGEGNDAFAVSYSSVAEDGTLDRVFVSIGGEAVRLGYHCDLAHTGAQSSLYGLFMGAGRERIDIYSEVDHLAGGCSSYQMVKGVADEQSTGAFTGRIYVAPGADGTSALQQSRNMTLTPTSRIVSVPQLEIYAQDVQCSHGASVGQLDREAIYYMQQRGIDEVEAKALQMSGFVNDIIDRCGDGSFVEEICNMASGRIRRV